MHDLSTNEVDGVIITSANKEKVQDVINTAKAEKGSEYQWEDLLEALEENLPDFEFIDGWNSTNIYY